jgi:hypothetical protein
MKERRAVDKNFIPHRGDAELPDAPPSVPCVSGDILPERTRISDLS